MDAFQFSKIVMEYIANDIRYIFNLLLHYIIYEISIQANFKIYTIN